MIRRKSDLNTVIKENWRGGPGKGSMTEIATREEMLDNGRVFGIMTFEPGCGIGIHKHEWEMEAYYIIDGNGEYYDNGKLFKVDAGDVTICNPGEEHGITNTGDTVMHVVALVVMQ